MKETRPTARNLVTALVEGPWLVPSASSADVSFERSTRAEVRVERSAPGDGSEAIETQGEVPETTPVHRREPLPYRTAPCEN